MNATQRPADRKHLIELWVQAQAVIVGIDETLSTARVRSIERRSAAAAQQYPVGVPIEYHGGGRIIGVR